MLSTKLTFVVSNTSTVIMKVYDTLGNLVAIPVNEKKPAGAYSVNFDTTDLPGGIYLYKVVTGSTVKIKKIILS
jgi:hypothetical protein